MNMQNSDKGRPRAAKAAKKIQSQFEYVIKDGARGCKFLFNPPEILEPLLIGAKAFRQRNCWEAG